MASSADTPSASATPTSTAEAGVVEAPQSEAEAIAAGTVAMQTCLDVRAEIEVNHPADSSAIDNVAMGEAAEKMHKIAASLTLQGTISAGSYAFDVTSAYAKTPFRRNRAVGILGASLVLALLVAGCSSPQSKPAKEATTTPTASATPTPTAVVGEVEEPQSAEEAIEGASSAATAYFAIRTEIDVEHPTDSSAIETVAVGEAAERAQRYALSLVEQGLTFEGAYNYEVTADSYASPSTGSDGTVYQFGTVLLVGCFDTSGITATNSDGSPTEMNPNRRLVLNVNVVYFAPEMTWMVQDVRPPDGNVTC